MLNLKKFAAALGVVGALLSSISPSHAIGVCEACIILPPPTFLLSLLNISPTADITDGVLVGVNNQTSAQYLTGGQSFSGGSSTSVGYGFPYPAPPSAYSFFLIGISGDPANDTLALFTSTSFANTALTDPTISTESFSTYFGVDPVNLISDLENGDSGYLSAFITAAITDNIGFGVPGAFSILTWDQPSSGGPNGSSSATPLPSTWTVMLIGLFGLGFVAYRRYEQKTEVVAA